MLVKFIIRNTLIGFILAAIFVGLLLWANVGNLSHLIATSDVGGLALFLLWFFNGIVFAGAQTSVSVLLMTETDGDDGGGSGDRIAVAIPLSQSGGHHDNR